MKILITGCSSGFGRLSARALADAGHRVFASMRDTEGKNAEAARELAASHDKISVSDIDVSSDDSVRSAVTKILADAGGLDVVINNAGVAGLGFLEGYTSESMRRLFEVNVFGAQRICRATLPALREAGGLLVFVSSTMGRIVVPCTGVYTASKFALEAIANSYTYELAAHGVEVSILEPGTHPTAIGGNMAQWSPDDPERVAHYGPNAELPGRIQQGIIDALSASAPPDPNAVARAIVGLVDAPKGSRPRRLVIDEIAGGGVEAINAACEDVQTGLIEGMGLSDLCGPSPATP